MTDAATDIPQLYLLSPERFEVDTFADRLARVLDAVEIACLRLTLPGDDEAAARRAADRLRDVAHARDVAVVVTDHLRLVEPHGLDGVHLSDGARQVRDARKALGAERIVGAFCGNSRHAGMTAGEIGADYIAFGPVSAGLMGDGAVAEPDLFQWWGQMIEVPQVAEGGLTRELCDALAPHVEFFGIGAEIWSADNPVGALRALRGGAV